MTNIENKFKSSCMYNLSERLKSYDNIYIYGAGAIGKFMLIYLEQMNLIDRVKSIIVTEVTKQSLLGKQIISIKDSIINDNDIVLISANKNNRPAMIETCNQLNIKNTIAIDFFDGLTPYELVPKSEYPLFMKCWYKLHTGWDLNLDDPITFNDKINWLKLHDIRPIRSTIVNKVTAKEYITNKIGAEYVIPLLGVYDKFDDIDFDKLPDKFVLKHNLGSSWNAIVKDKSKFDIQTAKKNFDKWIKINPAYINFLQTFENTPLKIVAEEYVENVEGDLYDYKFWCFYGEVKYVQLDRGRFTSHIQQFYTTNWELLNFTVEPNAKTDSNIFTKPKMLDEMIDVAKKLSSEFPFVRVDLYCVEDKIYFGEMTFSPLGGLAKFNPQQINYETGKFLNLDKIK